MTRRRPLGLALVAMFALSLSLTSQVSAAPRQTVSGVKSVTDINTVMTFGEKITAVAVEYASIVNPAPLQLNTFTVNDSYYDFRFSTGPDGSASSLTNIKPRTITKIYTNSVPAVTPDGLSVPGKYVIVELSALDWGGNTVQTNPASSSYVRVMPLDYMKTQVIQNKDVYAYTDGVSLGTPLGAGSTTIYKPTIKLNPLADQFVLENWAGPNGVNLPYYYRLPPNYDPNHLYPVVVILPGQGMGYLPSGPNPKVNVVADIPATAWLQPAWTGQTEDVISLAPQNQRVGADAEALSVLQLMDNFMTRFSVDPNRLYFTTCSYGSTTAWSAMSQRWGFFASGLLTGGFAVSAAQATNIAKARPLTPINITHGLHDPLLNINSTGYTSRDRMRAAYVATGLVDAAGAAALLPFAALDTPLYFNQVVPQIPGYTEPDNHAVDGAVYADPAHAYTLWLLAQHKP